MFFTTHDEKLSLGGWRNQKKSLLENVIVSGGADDTLLTAHGGLNAYPLHGPHHLHISSSQGCIVAQYHKACLKRLNCTYNENDNEQQLAAAWKQEWEIAGPSRIHRYIWDPGDGAIGGGDQQWLAMDHTKPSTNWGRSLQNINEEVGLGRQCCMRVRPPSEASLFDLGPEMRAWLHDTELDL
ncbi:hypothetical protein NQZ68_013886 [Dissostichus eleginoides]|nr:hypothetical protein NQZ68_013886 [Dissostichus eleginoides]